MKIYISIPISGRPIQDAKYHAESIRERLMLHGHECVTPFEVSPDPDKPYAYHIGRDIEALLADDVKAVVFGNGFHDSQGCRLEHAAAEIYHKRIVYETWFDFLDFTTLIPNPIK